MTKEQIAQNNYNEAMMRYAMQNAAPKLSLETRIDRLEREALAQRTAILRLERDNRWHRTVLWVLVFYVVTLPIVWMLNFPPPSVMP